jgi:hypothetical protein
MNILSQINSDHIELDGWISNINCSYCISSWDFVGHQGWIKRSHVSISYFWIIIIIIRDSSIIINSLTNLIDGENDQFSILYLKKL